MKNAFFSRALPAFNLGMVIASLPAQAGLYNSIVVFGDSLSDSGNNALVIGTQPNQAITGILTFPLFLTPPGSTATDLSGRRTLLYARRSTRAVDYGGHQFRL